MRVKWLTPCLVCLMQSCCPRQNSWQICCGTCTKKLNRSNFYRSVFHKLAQFFLKFHSINMLAYWRVPLLQNQLSWKIYCLWKLFCSGAGPRPCRWIASSFLHPGKRFHSDCGIDQQSADSLKCCWNVTFKIFIIIIKYPNFAYDFIYPKQGSYMRQLYLK